MVAQSLSGVYIIWLILLFSNPVQPMIPVLSPLLMVTSLDPDTSHTFVCSANGSNPAFDILIVRIDGLQVDNQEIQDRGIHVVLLFSNEGNSYNATIFTPATIENNGTEIQCFLFTENGSKSSQIATFYVQGLLEAPLAEILPINSTHLLFSWTPPFSLDLPDSDPDVIFYSFYESITRRHYNISSVQPFVFPVLAISVEFSECAWNVVGKGQKAMAIHQPCSLTEEQQNNIYPASITKEVTYLQNEPIFLSLTTFWPTNCFPLFSLKLAADTEEEEEIILYDRLIPRVTESMGETKIELLIPLQGESNSHYAVRITSISSQRNLTTEISLSTYDVQSVEISSTLTSITVRCQFDIESPAQGCSVHIRHTDSNGTFILSLLRGYNEQVTVDGLKWGVYTVCVYDIESNGVTNTDGGPAYSQTVHINRSPTLIPTISFTLSTEPSTTFGKTSDQTLSTDAIWSQTIDFITVFGVTFCFICGLIAIILVMAYRYWKLKMMISGSSQESEYAEVTLPVENRASIVALNSESIPTETNISYVTVPNQNC